MSKTIERLVHHFKVDIAYNQYAFDSKRRERYAFIKYEEDKEKEFTQAINQLLIEAKIEVLTKLLNEDDGTTGAGEINEERKLLQQSLKENK